MDQSEANSQDSREMSELKVMFDVLSEKIATSLQKSLAEGRPASAVLKLGWGWLEKEYSAKGDEITKMKQQIERLIEDRDYWRYKAREYEEKEYQPT